MSITYDHAAFESQFAALRLHCQFDEQFKRKVGALFLADVRRKIRLTKVGPDDVKWAPWAPSTATARAKKGNAALGLLFDSGSLYNSFVLDEEQKGFQLYSTSPYFGFLQQGTDKMPARPMLGMSKSVIEQVTKLINERYGAKALA
jgi:phage gpG-like protein